MKVFISHTYKENHHSVYTILALNIIALSLLFTGCKWSSLSQYDINTDMTLSSLKTEVNALYETFTQDSVDLERIDAIRMELGELYENEKIKGPENIETTKQIKMIIEMFERHVEDRMSSGKWNETHLKNQKENISDAFDIAIQTLRSKKR